MVTDRVFDAIQLRVASTVLLVDVFNDFRYTVEDVTHLIELRCDHLETITHLLTQFFHVFE